MRPLFDTDEYCFAGKPDSEKRPLRCFACNRENPPDSKFCGECGIRFDLLCPQCKASVPGGIRFCSQCGTDIGKARAESEGGARQLAPIETRQADGERRYLTVLFSDLVNSTEIASRLDPEEWREMVAYYRRAASDAVVRFGGHVAQYLGDGLVVYFGYPEAHENDAEAAVRAGLGIVEAMTPLNTQQAQSGLPRLSVRIGIDTGPVVVGVGASRGADVYGDTPNVAARVQAAAEPNTVLITPAVYKLVSGLFVVESHGAHHLKGVMHPLELYRVVRPTGVRGRLHAMAGRVLTPFVGRDEELRLLRERWERACEGNGQTVLVLGEAGIGKSRLLQEFQSHIRETPHTWSESCGEQFFENTPFHAIDQMLEQWLVGQGAKNAEERVSKLELALGSAGLRLNEAVPLIAEFLNLMLPERYPALLMAPEQKRRRLFAALSGWVFGAARLQPLVIVLEDLQWVDPSTLELIQMLAEQGAMVPLLLLCTARPEFRAPWPTRAHHAQLTLNRLSDTQAREMVGPAAGHAALGVETLEAVIKRATGVPLFIEELNRLVLESGGRIASREIPSTINGSLMARLDRLGPGKEAAQMAAVIGREFSFGLLHELSSMPEDKLHTALAKLTDSELIYARGIPPEATYLFKHALIQDAAYETLLKSRRRELHRRVARVMTDKFPALAEARPEVLARHWTEAGDAKPAIAAWQKAGDASRVRRAFQEAQEGYQQALAMLNTQPESPERDARELELQSTLGELLQITRGYAAPETLDANVRARMLAERTGNLAQLVVDMIGTWASSIASGDHSSATAIAEQMLDLARRERSPASLGFAHMVQISTRYHRGDFVGAEEFFKSGSEFFEVPGFRQFPGAVANTFGLAALNAWTLGRAEAAGDRVRQAVAAARENNSPYDLAFAQQEEGSLQVLLRQPKQAEASSAQALALSEKHGFPYFAAVCRSPLGWARAQLGRRGEGVALIRQGLTDMARNGTHLSVTRYLTYLAEAQVLEGAVAEALATVEEALQANPEELLYRPETLRLRGELRFSQGHAELAEADFREAIALAQQMSAKGWELRAAMSLGRILAKHGRRDEARSTLLEIYGWFTEGFDTSDLKDAKALLDELGG